MCPEFQDLHKMRPGRLQVFCSSVLYGIKIDVINLLNLRHFLFVCFCGEIQKLAFKQKLKWVKERSRPPSGNFGACFIEMGGFLQQIP